MIFAAGNLARKAKNRPPPLKSSHGLGAEMVYFREYVPDPTIEPFKAAMWKAGFSWRAVSEMRYDHRRKSAI